MSIHPRTAQQFDSSIQLGPLGVHYFPQALGPCLELESPSRLIIWDTQGNSCFVPEARGYEIKSTTQGTRFLSIRAFGKIFTFFPDRSPWPVDEAFRPIPNPRLRLFSKSVFEKGPHLFLFGEGAGFYDRNLSKWIYRPLTKEEPLDLPWMEFKLSLLRHENTLIPVKTPQYTRPIQKDNKIIKGADRAVLLNIGGENYWIDSQKDLRLRSPDGPLEIGIYKKRLTLPFEFVLDKFKMDTDPGTDNPASYESFVTMFSEEGPSEHHIFMNNPLKHQGLTFYQASYSQDPETGAYSSTLSVNLDPGRPIKYLGSLLLVFGSIWHYRIQSRLKRRSKKNSTDLSNGAKTT